jgi:hypothetical protein
MTLIRTALTDNSAGGVGGASYNDIFGALALDDCTEPGNSASQGGGIYDSSWLGPYGSLTLTDCAFSDNQPTNIVGGYVDGSGNTFS